MTYFDVVKLRNLRKAFHAKINEIQSRLSTKTFNGRVPKRSLETGSHYIQSLYYDQVKKKVNMVIYTSF